MYEVGTAKAQQDEQALFELEDADRGRSMLFFMAVNDLHTLNTYTRSIAEDSADDDAEDLRGKHWVDGSKLKTLHKAIFSTLKNDLFEFPISDPMKALLQKWMDACVSGNSLEQAVENLKRERLEAIQREAPRPTSTKEELHAHKESERRS